MDMSASLVDCTIHSHVMKELLSFCGFIIINLLLLITEMSFARIVPQVFVTGELRVSKLQHRAGGTDVSDPLKKEQVRTCKTSFSLNENVCLQFCHLGLKCMNVWLFQSIGVYTNLSYTTTQIALKSMHPSPHASNIVKSRDF